MLFEVFSDYPAIRKHRELLKERRDHVSQRWQAAGEHLPLFLDGMFDFSISILEARMEWVDSFIAKIEVKGGVTDSQAKA
ncbi:MAG: hypothetical protein WA996_09320 [Candidatus Promineifilaceae bacterium]